jgi:hypothetical protein
MSEKESEFKRFPRRQREDTSALTRGLASTTGEEDATPPRQKQQQQQLIFFFSFRPRRRLFGETEMGLHSANHWQSRDARRRERGHCCWRAAESTGRRSSATQIPVAWRAGARCAHGDTAAIGPAVHQDSCFVGGVWLVHSVPIQTFLFSLSYVCTVV